MLKRLMLVLTAIVASATSISHHNVRDIPQPPCWPCTSVK